MMTPAGYGHGRVIGRLTARLGAFVEQQKLGDVLGAETGFLLSRNPDTVRAPDVAFISARRLPPPNTRGYLEAAPDLAVEVLSPNDAAGDVLDKVHDWLTAGTLAVWIIDPSRKTIGVYRPNAPVSLLQASDTLIIDDVLPGFRLSVREIFD